MRILFVSNYFPPEVNAPATRLIEHARQWVTDGHEVEVLTSIPNFPEGRIYEGYSNRFQREDVGGIDVMRVPMYVAENKGVLKRTLSYVSYMLSCMIFCRRIRQRPDVVVATSPQFFGAIGGYFVARFFGVPFVLEVRDLWPESIVAVGAVKRNRLIRFFERLESWLYRKADHIVALTDAFRHHIEGKGIHTDKISVLKNGFDLQVLDAPLESDRMERMRSELGLEGKFVASYIGTIGMAHGVEVLLKAAQQCEDPDIVFMVVGTGAEREKLEQLQATLQLPNFRLVPKQPKEAVRYLLALSDVSVVHLKASPLFRTVIPSKMFEAMAMRTPIVLGVQGEAQEILEQAGAGIAIPPEDDTSLVRAVQLLRDDCSLYDQMGRSGLDYVYRHHDRKHLARVYGSILERVAGHPPEPVLPPEVSVPVQEELPVVNSTEPVEAA